MQFWSLNAKDFGEAQNRPRTFVVGVHIPTLLRSGAIQAPAPPSAIRNKARLSDMLLPGRATLAWNTCRMASNAAHYAKVFRGMQREMPAEGVGRGAAVRCISADVCRDPNSVFSAVVLRDLVPTLTTKNRYLAVFGDVLGKVTPSGRWLSPAERAICSGIVPQSLCDLSPKQIVHATGNTIPVSMIGRVLASVLRLHGDFNAHAMRMPCRLPLGQDEDDMIERRAPKRHRR